MPPLPLVPPLKTSLSLPQLHSLLANKQPGRTELPEKQLLCRPRQICDCWGQICFVREAWIHSVGLRVNIGSTWLRLEEHKGEEVWEILLKIGSSLMWWEGLLRAVELCEAVVETWLPQRHEKDTRRSQTDAGLTVQTCRLISQGANVFTGGQIEEEEAEEEKKDFKLQRCPVSTKAH